VNTKPSYRKPVGMLGMLLLILIWAVLVASLSHSIETWPTLFQGIFYLIAGTMWILPLRPLLLWMETGKWRE
jgi:predicted membrane channel-forming protein YqfA (hemolysin III family)